MIKTEYKLLNPSPQWEKAYFDYYRSWQESGEPLTPWASGLRGMTYEGWLADIERRRLAPVGAQVPATLLVFCSGATIYGFLDLRHHLNALLAKTGGHIGYGIHPTHRGKGLAPVMLGLGLQEARLTGLKEVLLTCYRDNLPSKHTIERCGGVFESSFAEPDGRVVLRYWIDLK